MVYSGTGAAEFIVVRPMDELDKEYGIELVKMPDGPTFVVACDYDDDWGYEFFLENNSDYERVKFCIMEAIFECDTMYELLDVLSEVFEDGFEDILVEDDCDATCDCVTGCNHCGCK